MIYFSTELADCLRNEPDTSIYTFDEILPGVVYDANHQCNFLFPGSRYCRTGRMCQKLYCRVNNDSCITNNEPPADGTKCDENMVYFPKTLKFHIFYPLKFILGKIVVL